MFGGFQPNAFQPDTYQNTDIETIPPAPTTGGGGGRSRGRRLARQRVILPDDTEVYVNEFELQALLKEFVHKTVKVSQKRTKVVKIVGADLDRIELPDFGSPEPFRLELPQRFIWQPAPNLYAVVQRRIAEQEEEARLARRRKLKKILLMMH
jgi:hypothetical protein